MKKFLSFALAVVLLFCTASALSSCGKEEGETGTITVLLDETYAPITVKNFLKLVDEKFYDGLTFHRIIDGFMIQGGDPNGDGTGGSKETIKGEFSSNGVENPLSHKRGVISMARASDADSASSQFFICQADATSLDGDYASFGWVLSGMDVVDKIAKCEQMKDYQFEDYHDYYSYLQNGVLPKSKQPTIVSVRRAGEEGGHVTVEITVRYAK